MKNVHNLPLAIVGGIAVFWPFIFNQAKLAGLINPTASSTAEPTAVFIILASFFIGSACIISSFSDKRQQLKDVLRTLIMSAVLSVVIFVLYFTVFFMMNF